MYVVCASNIISLKRDLFHLFNYKLVQSWFKLLGVFLDSILSANDSLPHYIEHQYDTWPYVIDQN